MKRPSLALFAALSLVDATSAVAQTDDPNTAQCVEAYVHGQELQKVHKLVEARNEYRVCSQTSCKDFIVKDCSMWLDTVQESLPAVVPIAIDDADNAISQAKVLMDGAELVARIDGRSVEVDPGLHTFTFEAPDGRKVDRIVLVPEGDKGVRVLVVLPRPPVEDPPRPQTPALLVPEVEPSGTTGGSSMSSSGSLWTVALWASGATAVSATAVGARSASRISQTGMRRIRTAPALDAALLVSRISSGRRPTGGSRTHCSRRLARRLLAAP